MCVEIGLQTTHTLRFVCAYTVVPAASAGAVVSTGGSAGSGVGSGSGVVGTGFTTAFLAEQRRSLGDKRQAMEKVFPRNGKLITLDAAWLALVLKHLIQVLLVCCYV